MLTIITWWLLKSISKATFPQFLCKHHFSQLHLMVFSIHHLSVYSFELWKMYRMQRHFDSSLAVTIEFIFWLALSWNWPVWLASIQTGLVSMLWNRQWRQRWRRPATCPSICFSVGEMWQRQLVAAVEHFADFLVSPISAVTAARRLLRRCPVRWHRPPSSFHYSQRPMYSFIPPDFSAIKVEEMRHKTTTTTTTTTTKKKTQTLTGIDEMSVGSRSAFG